MTDAIRKQLYTLLIVVAGGMALAHPLRRTRPRTDLAPRREQTGGEKPEEMAGHSTEADADVLVQRPIALVYRGGALVDNGTFVIGQRDPAQKSDTNKYGDTGIVFEDGWQTVDKVMNPATGEFYSTKPPLLPVLMAGEYWLLKHAFGWTLNENAETIVRIELVTFNLLPFVLYLVLLGRLLDLFGTTDWGRLFVMATACFGTLMTPFLISMNNHTLGTCSALFAIYFASKVWTDERPGWDAYLGAGFFATFTVCNELPALAFALGLFVLMGLKDRRRTLTEFVPAALVPAAAFLLTNFMAMGEFTPTYEKFGGPWYRYEGSHWAKVPDPVKPGIDFARTKESVGTYAFHVLLGHHGLFSLTPYVFLSLAGMFLAITRRAGSVSDGGGPSLTLPARLQARFGLLTFGLTVVIVGFYLVKSNNYGGWTNGPRWLMWLTPFWLLTMLPIADQLSTKRWGRGLAYALLGLSVMSMSYSLWNPWRHPWIYRWMDANGWIPY